MASSSKKGKSRARAKGRAKSIFEEITSKFHNLGSIDNNDNGADNNGNCKGNGGKRKRRTTKSKASSSSIGSSKVVRSLSHSSDTYASGTENEFGGLSSNSRVTSRSLSGDGMTTTTDDDDVYSYGESYSTGSDTLTSGNLSSDYESSDYTSSDDDDESYLSYGSATTSMSASVKTNFLKEVKRRTKKVDAEYRNAEERRLRAIHLVACRHLKVRENILCTTFTND